MLDLYMHSYKCINSVFMANSLPPKENLNLMSVSLPSTSLPLKALSKSLNPFKPPSYISCMVPTAADAGGNANGVQESR